MATRFTPARSRRDESSWVPASDSEMDRTARDYRFSQMRAWPRGSFARHPLCHTVRVSVRICLLYDCLYPYTVGGAEHWYRDLTERLAEEGHEVTYVTLRQWPQGEAPQLEGVEVVVAGPRMELYVGGRRRILPPLVFAFGGLWHLLRHGSRYDVVHTAAGPFFPLLSAVAARRVHGFRLAVDWFEVWPRGYWREYLGEIRGSIAWTDPARMRADASRGFLQLAPAPAPPSRRGISREADSARRPLQEERCPPTGRRPILD